MKIKALKFCLAFILLIPNNAMLHAQEINHQAKYLNGKELYNLGKYELALESFRSLTKIDHNNPFQEVASFYFALSAYHSGDKITAENMFTQILKKHNDWSQLNEAILWLSRIKFENGEYTKALALIEEINDPKIKEDAKKMKFHFLDLIQDVATMRRLIEKPEIGKEGAEFLANKLVNRAYDKESRDLLKEIVSRYKLQDARYKETHIAKFKNEYKVAVMLPLMLDDLSVEKASRSGNFVLDLYSGIMFGIEELMRDSIPVKFYVYDTKKDSAVTSLILRTREMQGMDLIIGPLYPFPSRLTSKFSLENKINMINPLSHNSGVMSDNPYSFLFKPSLETQAKKAAQLAAKTFTANKKFYVISTGAAKDTVLAYTYIREIKKAGYELVKNLKVEGDAKKALEFLKESYEKGDEEEYDEGFVVGQLKIHKDSIGHIFVASTNELLVANTISTVETRRDNVPLIGHEEWLDMKVLNIEQLGKMNLYLVAPNFIDLNSATFIKFRENYIARMKTLPNSNVYTGYEISKFASKILLEYGSQFQNGLHKGAYIPGEVYNGFRFKESNDNQYVPVLKIEGTGIKVVNKEPFVTMEE